MSSCSRSSIRPTMPKSSSPITLPSISSDVARVGVGVVEAVGEDHLQVEVGPAAGDLVQVEPGGGQLLGLRELDALDQLHRQHAAGAQLGVGRGMWTVGSSAKSRANCCMFRSSRPKSSSRLQTSAGTRPRSPAGGSCWNSGIRSASWASPARMSRSTATFRSMSACWTLTTTGSPVLQPGPVHLADRGRGHRLVVELVEQLLDRPAQLRLDRRCGPPRADRPARRSAGAASSSARCDAHQVGPRAEHLAELDERRPQFGQGQPDPGLPARAGRWPSRRGP